MAPWTTRVFAVLVILITLVPGLAIRMMNHPIWALYWILGVCIVGLAVGVALGARAVYKVPQLLHPTKKHKHADCQHGPEDRRRVN
jgi:uncharacterized membrane protein YfcA